MRLASVDHRVVQIAVAHFYLYVQVSLIRKACVVQTTVLKVAIFEVDFAGCKQLTEIDYFLLQVTVHEVETLLMTQDCNTAQIKVIYRYYGEMLLNRYHVLEF